MTPFLMGQTLGYHTAPGKVQGGSIFMKADDADKYHGSPRHGKKQIFLARIDGPGIHGMHDQRQGSQGHKLIEKVQGNQAV